MRPLSASELLRLWERGLGRQPTEAALALLEAACPETPADVLAEQSLGQRDASLLTLREWTFGSQLVGVARCPKCNERLELTFDVADIRTSYDTEPVEELSLSLDEYDVQFRLPNSLDLVATAGHEDVASTRQALLERCLLAVHHHGGELPATQLPPEVAHAVVERMAQADPQADVQLSLTCPACNHQWQAVFDIVSFFWNEVNAWAQRVLREVHTLASTYGWREADILAMSPWRRQCYLEMVGG